jgi:hypothetical protein
MFAYSSFPFVCQGMAEVYRLPARWHRELFYLSGSADPDTQAALDRLLLKRGQVVQRVRSFNLNPTAGRNLMGGMLLPNGTWFIGQKGTGTPLVTDTTASHPGWVEITTYTQTTRPSLVMGASWVNGSNSNASSVAIFTAPASAGITFHGWLLINNSAKGGPLGTIVSVADHGAPVAVVAADALRQTIVATVT